jgi:hypothetical protein
MQAATKAATPLLMSEELRPYSFRSRPLTDNGSLILLKRTNSCVTVTDDSVIYPK